MSDSDDTSTVTDRRTVLQSLGAATVGGLSFALFDSEIVRGIEPEPVTDAVDWTGRGPTDRVFSLSVASGGPTPSGAILWTRIDPDAYVKSEPAYVQVGTDETFTDIVYEGRIESGKITPDHDHVIKVDLDGTLPSDRHLFYRFRYDDTTSQIGRCRTLPLASASPERVSLAVVTCQSFQDGYYPAYSHIAAEDVDFIVHLGDQIYEYAGESQFEGRSIELPSEHDIAWGIEDFRHLWATYRGDEHYQRALERHSLIPTWDDHEIVNNRYWDYENDRPWSNDHPKNDDEKFMKQLFVDGIKAWWEYNPARVEYNPDAKTLFERFHMWRTVRFGDLLELPVTDERLFRSLPPGGDAAGQRQWGTPPGAPEHDDGDRTMLGFEQRAWFLKTVRETDATWKVWPNEVAFSPLLLAFEDDQQFGRNYDAWDGYEHEREEILGQLTHFDVDNFVALTGDMHTYLVSYLLNDYENAQNRTPILPEEERVGIEFMTPAISSNSGTSDFWGTDGTSDESASPALTNETMTESVLEENPHVEFFNAKYNGYSVIELTPDDCTWRTYAVDDTVDTPNADRQLLRKYRVPTGSVELNELEAHDSL